MTLQPLRVHGEDALTLVTFWSGIMAIAITFNKWRLSGCPSPKVMVLWPLQFLKRRLKAWEYLSHGPQMIQEGFDKAKGRPFEVLAPDNRYIFVSSPEHIEELENKPQTCLSLQAASKQMLQPQYSMHGFNWFDHRGTEGVGRIRALRHHLTNYLPRILPTLKESVGNKMTEMLAYHQSCDVSGTSRVKLFPMIKQLVVLSHTYALFGAGLTSYLARNEKFKRAALAYVEETIIIAEIMRVLPKWLHRFVGPIMRRMASSQNIVYQELVAVAKERVQERDLGLEGRNHEDCIQWIMKSCPKEIQWTPQRIVFELLAIWFGSVHAFSTTITFAIHDLCLHPEYVEPLRKEVQSPAYAAFEKTGRGLALLDSFLKESARLTPAESMSTRRQAMTTISLSDGTRIEPGDWTVTPVSAMMQTDECFPDPMTFNGFRFVDPKLLNAEAKDINKTMQPAPSQLTDMGLEFHVWGSGRQSCPGRFYAAATMKVFLAHILRNYDVKLVDPDAPRSWTWRSFTLPRSETKVEFTPLRSVEGS